MLIHQNVKRMTTAVLNEIGMLKKIIKNKASTMEISANLYLVHRNTLNSKLGVKKREGAFVVSCMFNRNGKSPFNVKLKICH